MEIELNQTTMQNGFNDLKRSYELDPQDNTLNAMALIGEDLRRNYGIDLRPYA